jgi:hypothetical protein
MWIAKGIVPMPIFFTPILAAALMAQLQGGTIEGKVFDDQGKPVDGAQIVFFAPPPREGGVDPVEVRTTSNAAGLFRLTSPPLGRFAMNGVHVWAYRPGSAVTAAPSYLPPLDLVLQKPAPRFIKVEGSDGRPVVGAIVSPRVVSVAGGNEIAEIPDSLATALAVTTGADGNAPLAYLQNQDQLVAVRVTADAIGSQDFPLMEVPRREQQGATITIRLGTTSHLTGRVRTRAGEPVPGQTVEVWFQGGTWLPANPVIFRIGSLHTAADGSFQTPDNLMVGSPYRVVIHSPGMEPILSEWITIGEKPRVLLPMIQRPLRSINGRVVDRQGMPVAGIEIFQSGDGPERTATKTDGDGRFTLGGFRQGSVFLFARGEEFRFFGQMIKLGVRDITVEVTRVSEHPRDEMRILPEVISWDESRALARRLIEPYWQAIVAQKNPAVADRAFRYLAAADPVGVLQKLDAAEFANSGRKPIIQAQVARALARTNPKQAQEVAEAIATPANRASALLSIVDALPPEERDRKLAVLNRATVHARDAKGAYEIANVAERWYELGEKAKAKAMFAESVLLPKDTPLRRGFFAARLARVDLAAALAIAREFPANGRPSASSVLRNIALHLATDNPAEAERVMRLVPQEKGHYWLPPAIAWKMAAVDPGRAWKLVDESQRYYDHPQAYLFLAVGLKPRDPAGADRAFQTALRGIDRLMKDGTEFSAMMGFRGIVLPLVEQIDPALVPELFWRTVATRPPTGNPRSDPDPYPTYLARLLGWYDRDVASVLFEPVRDRMEHLDDVALARAQEFRAWSIFDPRAAVARLEQVPINPKLEPSADFARERVAEILALPHEERWRRVWSDYTEMRDLVERDFR